MVVAGDDGWVYEFDNIRGDPNIPDGQQLPDAPLNIGYAVGSGSLSCTPGIGPNKEYFLWEETNTQLWMAGGYGGPTPDLWESYPDYNTPGEWDLGTRWIHGAPAIDNWGARLCRHSWRYADPTH